jgi:hypothetical protein
VVSVWKPVTSCAIFRPPELQPSSTFPCGKPVP